MELVASHALGVASRLSFMRGRGYMYLNPGLDSCARQTVLETIDSVGTHSGAVLDPPVPRSPPWANPAAADRSLAPARCVLADKLGVGPGGASPAGRVVATAIAAAAAAAAARVCRRLEGAAKGEARKGPRHALWVDGVWPERAPVARRED